MNIWTLCTKCTLCLALFLLGSASLALADATLYNQSHACRARMASDGTVRDCSNRLLGKIASDGTIRNSSNAMIGRIAGDTFRNQGNGTLGRINSEGRVYNASNAYIGRVDNQGRVSNAQNATIGLAQGVPPKQAAALYFFRYFDACSGTGGCPASTNRRRPCIFSDILTEAE